MSFIASKNNPERMPSRWADFNSHMPGLPTRAFGFKAGIGEINRWAARYRAAASFEGASLVGYQSKDTVDGYSALIRAVLVWSAFEKYLAICGLDQKTSTTLISTYTPGSVAAEVAKIDRGGLLFGYIRSQVTNPTLAKELDAFSGSTPFNTTYLLSAIRHIFGHGHLTPSANDASALATRDICNLLCDFHLHVMDADFGNKVDQFEMMMRDEHSE